MQDPGSRKDPPASDPPKTDPPRPGPPKPPPGPPPAPSPGLAAVVEAANRLYVAGALETALAIAELVLDRLLGGDEAALERPQENPLLRALAAHPDLRFSPSFLWTALAVRRQLPLLPAELREQLTLTHHRLLLGIPDPRAKAADVTRWRADHHLPPLGEMPLPQGRGTVC